jgi:primosomal protein N' (replication factor Y)
MRYEVIVATNIEQKLTYESDALLQPGNVVVVPLRNRATIGAVNGLSKEKNCEYKLKSISVILPFVFSEHCMTFIKWFSEYNLFSLGMALKMMVPFTPDVFVPKATRKAALPEECDVMEINLSSIQQEIAQRLLSKRNFSVDLIDGVTGSGKTEVYLYLVQQRLKENPLAQVLVLLPEIALTSALMSRFKKYFGFEPLIWHSNMTKAQKFSIWKTVIEGKQAVVIGARSALFLPFANLAMIVVDEEHDPSYKQNEQGFYNARDMAIVRAQIENIPILLISATPSLETVQNVKLGKFGVEKLASRYANATLPLVNIVDMRQEQGRPVLSTPLSDAISAALSRHEQVLIFVNQRGYTPLSLCKNCGYKWKCAVCDVNLIEHKALNRFMCHHCGGGREISRVCPECGKENTRISLGIGAERALETIQRQFPSARCLSISSDTVSSKKALTSAMDAIYNNKVDIIIGTQILAKGHHFPNLTVVGVIEADHGAGGCDLRANERTYQLLDQVSGRAGREQKQGNVFIQTYMPTALIILALANRERDTFYKHELKDRETHSMPPFKSLIAVILSGNVEIDVQKCARRWGQLFGDLVKEAANQLEGEDSHVENLLNAQLLGPAPAPISRLRGKYRYRLLIKADKRSNLQRIIRCLTKRESFSVDVQIDVDPYEFL